MSDSGNIKLFGAHHEVNVGNAGVQTASLKLFGRHGLAALKVKGIRADGQVTGGIFVKQCVVIQNTAFRDRGAIRNKGNLAKIMRAFIHGDQAG